ncbi:hypothetical protein B0H19DRAFT_1081356 [Mycena capillaripes]|nr:hypothetical protein B0H19DRAFT_1081200 [Mycena capillaripes]KAJ6533192.1 hypothetical protein B0H19DRAFT_1081356 [Mycena capillaripes]
MAPCGVDCADCGLFFKYLESSRDNCFKCSKLRDCGDNETQMTATRKLKQCLYCGLEYPFLADGRTQCVQCKRRDQNARPSTKDKENAVKPNPKEKSASTAGSVIEIDSDTAGHGSDADSVQEVSKMDVLKAKIGQNRKAASQIRLTKKVKTESEPIPSCTCELLKLRETARNATLLKRHKSSSR